MNSRFVPSLLRGCVPALTALALAAMVSTSANAASLITASGSGQLGQEPITSSFTNTSNTGVSGGYSYNFVYTSLASALSGAPGAYGNISLDSLTPAPPDGGPFLALDSDFGVGNVMTTIATVAGDVETVSFYFAATQQTGCPQCQGPSNDTLTVDLASDPSQSVGPIMIASQSASAYTLETLTFVAPTTGSETLSFLASSTTGNVPAFALVDDLTVAQTLPPAPEPNSLILLGTGLAGLGGLVRSRFAKSVKA